MPLAPATNDVRITGARLLATALVGAATTLSACGSATIQELPPAAQPARSPALTSTPAGTTAPARTKPDDDPLTRTAIAGGRVAIADEGDNTLTVVGRDGARERTISTGTQPGSVTSLNDGKLIAVVALRERVLEIYDAHTLKRIAVAPAGVGPTHVVCGPTGPCYVTDTEGDALLVFRVGADGSLRLTRRVYVAGAPYGIAIDPERKRLWVTLTARNELVELPAHRRPHILQRIPTVRQPDRVAVDASTGDVTVTSSRDGLQQLLRDPKSPDN